MPSFASRRVRGNWFGTILLAASVLAGSNSVGLAVDNDSGPTQAQVDCQNRAVNDYWDNVKGCERNLADIPDQLKLCKDDARADLTRAKQRCVSAARAGAAGGPGGAVVLDPGTRPPRAKPPGAGASGRLLKQQ